MQFLNQNIKRFRDTGLEGIIATNDGFVDLGTTGYIIRFDR